LIPKRNIECHEVHRLKITEPGLHEVEVVQVGKSTVFVHIRGGVPDAVINWSGSDAETAQRYLAGVSFARCARTGCGVRVSKLGDECGNHGKGGDA